MSCVQLRRLSLPPPVIEVPAKVVAFEVASPTLQLRKKDAERSFKLTLTTNNHCMGDDIKVQLWLSSPVIEASAKVVAGPLPRLLPHNGPVHTLAPE